MCVCVCVRVCVYVCIRACEWVGDCVDSRVTSSRGARNNESERNSDCCNTHGNTQVLRQHMAPTGYNDPDVALMPNTCFNIMTPYSALDDATMKLLLSESLLIQTPHTLRLGSPVTQVNACDEI